MKNVNVIAAEWLFVLSVPSKGRSRLVTVAVENVDAKDMPMARALAAVAAVWLNAVRRLS